MKILYLATWFPHPLDNGSKIRVYHLLQALAGTHQVSLAAFAFGTADIEGAADLRRMCADVRTVPCDPFQRSTAAHGLRFFSFAPIVAKAVPEMTRTVQQLNEQPFDLVIASTVVTAAYALPEQLTTSRILEEHNSGSRWMWERLRAQRRLLSRWQCWASWQKTRLYESRLFPRFDLVTMVSEQDRHSTLTMLPGYKGRVEVVPNGVDCDRNRPGLVPAMPGTLVFNGSLTYDANYDAVHFFLAEILPYIRQQAPDVSLTVTGSTDGVDLAGIPLSDAVRLSGYVPDVRPLVASAWGCVVPIRLGGGTRLKVLEAMALGTPVVATRKGIEGYDIVPGEHALIADDPADFARSVLELLRNPDLRARLSQNGRRFVEELYDWKHIGASFCALCEATFEARQRG